MWCVSFKWTWWARVIYKDSINNINILIYDECLWWLNTSFSILLTLQNFKKRLYFIHKIMLCLKSALTTHSSDTVHYCPQACFHFCLVHSGNCSVESKDGETSKWYTWSTAETWTLRKVDQKYISFEMWCWRRMDGSCEKWGSVT